MEESSNKYGEDNAGGQSLACSVTAYLLHKNQIPKIFSTRYPITCTVYTGYHATSETEHGSPTCTVNNPLAKALGLFNHTGGQNMLYLSLVSW